MRPLRFLAALAVLAPLSFVATSARAERRLVLERPKGVSLARPARFATPPELEATARRALEATARRGVEFVGATARRLPGGERAVVLRQRHLGVPVLDHGASVVFGRGGEVRLVASRVATELPTSVTPSLNAAEAAAVASSVTRLPHEPSRAHLVVWSRAGEATLAWAVDPPAIDALPERPVVLIDATTGDLLARWDAVRTLDKARVYATNPVASPMLTDVTLPVAEGSMALENARVASRNCLDKKTVKKVYGYDIHICDLLPKAAPDDNGDYLLEPGSDTEPEDAFAEVSMFHHANRAYTYFLQFDPGLDVNGGKPLPTVSNVRFAPGLDHGQFGPDTSNPDVPLAPYQNAFFSPAQPMFAQIYGITGGAMWFGQGPSRDYSYDGDVVYHEFTHAVVEATLQLSGMPHLDAFGATYAPGAMNEGLADYFSSAIAGDPNVGEYAVGDIGVGDSIRSLTATDACPAAVGGEPHQDSVLFSAALWDVRSKLGALDQVTFDGAVFSAMNASPTGDLAYEDFAALVGKAVAATTLGEDVVKLLDTAWQAHGILPKCTRILEYTGGSMQGPEMLGGRWMSPGAGTTGVGAKKPGWTPGVVQFHAKLAAGATSLKVAFGGYDEQGAAQGGKPKPPKVAVRFGQPLQFTYKPLAVPADAVVVDAEGGEGTVEVPPGATDAYAMVLNGGIGDTMYTEVAFTVTTPTPPPPPPPPVDPVVEPPAVETLTPTGGCATHPSGGSSSEGALAGVLAMFGLARAVRRKRR